MANVNIYVSPNITNDAVTGIINPMMNPYRGGGGTSAYSIFETFAIAVTDTATSVYRIFKNLNANIVPLRIMIATTAMAGLTSAKLGLYLPNYGAIIGTGNQFMNAQTFASAIASLNPKTAIDGMAAAAIGSYQQRLFEWAGETTSSPTIATSRVDAFDLCLTTVTQTGTAGTVSVLMDFVNA